MLETEQDDALKQGIERDILQEHYESVEDLKRDLQLCKVEQSNLRTELEILRTESQKAGDVRESFNRIHLEECGSQDSYMKEIANLQERITLLETEKESALQLWHISLNTISALEEQLKGCRTDGKGTKFYQEQANAIKESYSEAIKMLEEKLSQAKENFVKHQTLYQTSKDRIECLTKEKDEVLQKYRNLQEDSQEKDRNNQVTIETLKKDLAYSKAEANRMVQAKQELEKKLCEVKKYAENIMEKDKETKSKMLEAIELIESAVREKDLVLHREALVSEEKARLEHRLAIIANEYDVKIQELNKRTKEEIESNTKKYVTEIKELKGELKERTVLVEKAQRELKFSEEELSKIRRDSSEKLLEYEQKAKRMEFQLQVYDEAIAKNKYDLEIKQLRDKVTTLESKLVTSNDKLQNLEQQHSSNLQDQVKRTDRENKDIMKQYSDLESQLAKTLGDKEDLVLQLKSLKHDFDYEIQKRDNERHSLENKIRELEVNLHKANCIRESKLREALVEDANPYPYDLKNKRTLDIKWRDEAKSLTVRFQGKTKELRGRISALQKDNSELSRELLTCKQELAQHTIQDIQRCNEANEIILL